MISIITPTYNEKDGIEHFVASVSQTMKGLNQPFEIVVVDDNSPDGTADLVIRLRSKYPQLNLLKRAGKLGIGSAYFDGFAKAKGDFLIGIDADLSPGVEVLPLFVERLKAGDGMVIGSRYLRKSRTVGVGLYKANGSRVFNIFTRIVLGVPASDITHSNRAMTKKCFEAIAPKIKTKDHPSFFVECSFWAKKLGFRISEVPITFTERTTGRSKLNINKGLRNALKTIAKLRLGYE